MHIENIKGIVEEFEEDPEFIGNTKLMLCLRIIKILIFQLERAEGK